MLKLISIFLLQAVLLVPAFAGEKGGNHVSSEFIRSLESSTYIFSGCNDLLDRTDDEVVAVCGHLPVMRPDLAKKNKQVQALLKCCPTVLW